VVYLVRWSVEADDGVDVDDTSGLELDHFGVRDLGEFVERFDGQPCGSGEVTAKGDGEPAPEFRGMPLPCDVTRVVVALVTQRLTDVRVVDPMPADT
jgi:hypothetical protein